MSKMMNDSALTVSAAVRSKAPSIGFLDIVDTNNQFNPAPGMPKKTVSFETHSQIVKIMSDAAAKESSAVPPQSPPQLQQATAPTSETDSNKPMHKGILKVIIVFSHLYITLSLSSLEMSNLSIYMMIYLFIIKVDNA